MIRGIDEELRAAKYAHVERERRFLVDPRRCPALDHADSFLIEDRYIDRSRCRLRRMTEGASGRVVMKLSKKYDVSDVMARPVVPPFWASVEVTHDDRYQGSALAHLTAAAITPLLHGACA